MRTLMICVVTSLVIPAAAFADNVGQCGVGSKLFDGQSGIAPQVLAISTNGTFMNTLGISSGTSGCTHSGVVRSAWRTAAFVGQNMNQLARDISRGEGESVEVLATLVGVTDEHRVAFLTALQSNFSQIFAREDISSTEVTAAMQEVLARESSLARYAVNI